MRTLQALAAVAKLVNSSAGLDDTLGPVLRILGERLGLQRVAVCVADDDSATISIEAAYGLTPAEVRRGRYTYDEGVIGKVVASGQPELVLRVSQDPRFLDRTGALDDGIDMALICVPVICDGAVVGAMSAYRTAAQLDPDKPPPSPDDLQRDQQTLAIVAAMLAPAVAARALRSRAEVPLAARSPANMIGRSKAIQTVYDLVARVAPSPTTVLLLGESGTGKELVASAIHDESERRRGAFVKVNCAALPESIIESELFGHERGAFTGAHQQRRGRFELAQGGTIFLDEIGDLSASTQIKLLRVLQQREFQRVGSSTTHRVDVRVIAATSRDLEAMIDDGSFRTDLYYRLNVFPIHLPALRDRRSDILLLADHFVEVFNRTHGRQVRRISTPAIDMLLAYHWPGNVRELENCIERAVLMARDDVIQSHHLPPSLQTAEASGTGTASGLKVQLERFERDLVLDALKSARGNMAAAARELGISERIIGLRVEKYGIDPRRFKNPTVRYARH